MHHAAYRWIAWVGLWLLIAANAARADLVSPPQLAPAAGSLTPPMWGLVAMLLVLSLWAIVAQAISRIRARRVLVRVTNPQRKRPQHPS